MKNSEFYQGGAMEELCNAIYLGRKNARLFGCCKISGHKGLHVNGKNQMWSTGVGELRDSDGKPRPISGGLCLEDYSWPESTFTIHESEEI